MKKYLRTVALVYVTFLVGFVFWWMFSTTGGRTINNMVFDGYFLKKETKPVLQVKRFHFDSKTANTTAHSDFKSALTWRQEFSRDEDANVKDNIQRKPFCNNNFIGYDGKFAKLINVIIDPVKGQGRRGGEKISEVLNQPEENEYFNFQEGYFKLYCEEKIRYMFNPKTHVRQWLDVLQTTTQNSHFKVTYTSWTIAVKRYEYVNLYHTMTDFYNAFLVSKMFKMQPGNITILWIDGHPLGTLDITWETLFGKVLRAGDIKEPSMFNHMIWGIMGYDSPLNEHNNKNVSYLEDFRTFFLSRHGVSDKSVINCNKLKIMFLWRRNYVAHPRNPSGSVSRKIKNEEELLESAKKHLPGHELFGIQIDKLDMKAQLELISNTDILIGMHGAGLSHTLFLPKHAGLIELYPVYWSTANRHFKAMARWRNFHYLSWVNVDPSRELPDRYTMVDVEAVTDLIGTMKERICRK